jgi:hypothetical protein
MGNSMGGVAYYSSPCSGNCTAAQEVIWSSIDIPANRRGTPVSGTLTNVTGVGYVVFGVVTSILLVHFLVC